jgi:predicted DNA-binding mobile mystery protein A
MPKGGWIRAVREALGMSMAQYAQRLNKASSNAFQIERAEVSGSITLSRLRKAADALKCDVAVVLVPRTPLESIIRERARALAERRIGRIRASMDMEKQSISKPEIERLIEETTQDIIDRGDPELWN